MDFYHAQIMEGTQKLRRHIGRIGHIQIASVPDRSRRELNVAQLFAELDALAGTGWSVRSTGPWAALRTGWTGLPPHRPAD